MDVTKPYKFIGFGAMDITKPYEFIGFGAMDVTKPSEFIGFGAMDVTKPENNFESIQNRSEIHLLYVTQQCFRAEGQGAVGPAFGLFTPASTPNKPQNL